MTFRMLGSGGQASLLVCGLALLNGLSTILAAGDPQTSDHGTVLPISPALCEDMMLHHVLSRGAPVGCERLKLIKFDYFGFDGRSHDDGEIIIMDAAAGHV